MKEAYTKPSCEIEKFNTIEVLTASSGDVQPDDNVVDGSDGW